MFYSRFFCFSYHGSYVHGILKLFYNISWLVGVLVNVAFVNNNFYLFWEQCFIFYSLIIIISTAINFIIL